MIGLLLREGLREKVLLRYTILMDKAQINERNLMVFLTYLEFLQL